MSKGCDYQVFVRRGLRSRALPPSLASEGAPAYEAQSLAWHLFVGWEFPGQSDRKKQETYNIDKQKYDKN